LQTGDRDGYRKLCHRMLDAFGENSSTKDIPSLAHTCVAGPDSLGDRDLVIRLASKRLAILGPEPWSFHVMAFAHYRAGNHQSAIEWLNKASREFPGWDFAMLNWLVLSMAQHKLGHAELARQSLAAARREIESQKRKNTEPEIRFAPPGLHWRDWLGIQLLLREAEESLQASVP
jgi:hypothetical protein